MYLPAMRPGQVAPEHRRPDLNRLAQALGPQFFWLHREHDDDVTGRRMDTVSDDLRWFAGQVSSRTDLSDYLLMTDILVSDYASAIVEFGFTGRRVIHYAPDRAFFESVDPGAYISLDQLSAGPIVDDDDELVQELKSGAASGSPAQSASFSEELAPLDAQSSADLLLKHLGL
jgi:CDP-glycerol glycerophosphotransferase